MSIRFGFVSTYPPTHCGIATFTQSLMHSIQDSHIHSAEIVRLIDTDSVSSPEPEIADLISNLISKNPISLSSATKALNRRDVTVIQHEFGIYGGTDGREVIEIINRLHTPTIVVVHTVLTSPTWHQRIVFTQLTRSASAVVAMTKTAREILISLYRVEPAKIFVVPHGAPDFPELPPGEHLSRPLILTWGLIGPGKGIETAIDAMSLLRDLNPVPRYLVAGRTHPKVLERQGETYRDSLRSRIDELNLSDIIELDSHYLNAKDLAKLVSSASIVLLPYDSKEQMTSGVLIEAVTAGRPVVATRFPHATELLSDGVGIVVDQKDSDAMAKALRRILLDPDEAKAFSKRAKEASVDLLWPSVAAQYVELAQKLMKARAAA